MDSVKNRRIDRKQQNVSTTIVDLFPQSMSLPEAFITLKAKISKEGDKIQTNIMLHEDATSAAGEINVHFNQKKSLFYMNEYRLKIQGYFHHFFRYYLLKTQKMKFEEFSQIVHEHILPNLITNAINANAVDLMREWLKVITDDDKLSMLSDSLVQATNLISPAMVALLLENGFDPNSIPKNSIFPALLSAIGTIANHQEYYRKIFDIIKLLIAYRTDLDSYYSIIKMVKNKLIL